MAEIALPDRGQPLDLSYLLTVVSEINNLNRVVSNKAVNQSSIKYANASSTSKIVTSDLIFYASSNKVSPKFATDTDVTTRFDFNFKQTPIVTASVNMVTGTPVPIFAVITGLTNTSCQVRLFASGSITGDPVVNVSIIAIGERV